MSFDTECKQLLSRFISTCVPVERLPACLPLQRRVSITRRRTFGNFTFPHLLIESPTALSSFIKKYFRTYCRFYCVFWFSLLSFFVMLHMFRVLLHGSSSPF